jgi:hypothetical protein
MGRPLKPPEQRRNRHVPQRGEWVDLEPLGKPVLPAYDRGWQVPAWMWNGWRRDAVTSQYGEADVTSIKYLASEFYDLPPAQRLRLMDSLGLTPKGKRDLRWRTPAEVATIKKQSASVTRLRVVEDAVEGS